MNLRARQAARLFRENEFPHYRYLPTNNGSERPDFSVVGLDAGPEETEETLAGFARRLTAFLVENDHRVDPGETRGELVRLVHEE